MKVAVLSLTTEAIIAQLEEILPKAVAWDKRVLAEHRARNKVIAQKRRLALREVIKLPDDKLAEMTSYNVRFGTDRAVCPRSMAAQVESWLNVMRRDGRKRRTLQDGDPLANILLFDYENGPKPGEVC